MDQYQQAANQMMGGSVGGADVYPRYIGAVGGATVQPRYIGAPVQAVMPGQMTGQTPVQYSPTQYVAADVSYFGLGINTVGAGLTLPINIRPTRPFTPQRFGAPSTIIGLLILSVSIAGTNMFANEAGVPIEMFSEVSQFPQMEWMTIEPAVGVDFNVRNPTLGPLDFSGCLYGTQVRR